MLAATRWSLLSIWVPRVPRSAVGVPVPCVSAVGVQATKPKRAMTKIRCIVIWLLTLERVEESLALIFRGLDLGGVVAEEQEPAGEASGEGQNDGDEVEHEIRKQPSDWRQP